MWHDPKEIRAGQERHYIRVVLEGMMSIRAVKRMLHAKPTMEGAGVHLHRAFGFGNTNDFDPFLLLDDFRSDEPEEYLAGFPWHPHRGIETITYVLAGTVEHGDSIGNRGVISSGDIQWMTAGSGIIHQEMPHGDTAGRMYGFQLWANLPASLKMTAPRYQGVLAADVPLVKDEDGMEVRVVCGRFRNTSGPVEGVAANPLYLDVSIPAGKLKTFPIEAQHNVFAYVFSGTAKFGDASAHHPLGEADNRTLVLLDTGDEVSVHAGSQGVRFLLVAGKPLREPVAWNGPIVMNTQAELRQAFMELEEGKFLKHQAAG
jgi:redox-sensitive bicupin YhaK (pirin superfamily)